MKKRNVNIALIGCGRIGHLLELDPLTNKPCRHFVRASAAAPALRAASARR